MSAYVKIIQPFLPFFVMVNFNPIFFFKQTTKDWVSSSSCCQLLPLFYPLSSVKMVIENFAFLHTTVIALIFKLQTHYAARGFFRFVEFHLLSSHNWIAFLSLDCSASFFWGKLSFFLYYSELTFKMCVQTMQLGWFLERLLGKKFRD